MSIETITAKYNLIRDMLFLREPKTVLTYTEICQTYIDLCDALTETETDESVWYIGESSEAALDDILIGGFWHFTEWHAGQSSLSYAALCAIGGIYSPGMESAPESDGGLYTFEQLGAMANNERLQA